MRTLTFVLPAAAALALSCTSAQAQVTTRVEPRPFYGATVTVEHGVRVFRPLPPHDRVIINPGNRTPLYLNIGEGYRGGDFYAGDYYDRGLGARP